MTTTRGGFFTNRNACPGVYSKKINCTRDIIVFSRFIYRVEKTNNYYFSKNEK
jgi:hypothetical protein